jgi:hypothetical protein
MPEQLPDPRRTGAKKRASRKPEKTLEFADRLDQLAKSYPATRLMVDLARDAGLEVFRKQARQIRRLAHEVTRMRKKRNQLHDRLVEMLHEVTTHTIILPRPPGRPVVDHEALLTTFRRFKAADFPALAQLLHDRIGRGEVVAYQRFLVDEVLITGSRILAEHLIRHASQPATPETEAAFARTLHDHIAGNVLDGLAKKVSYQMTPDEGQPLGVLIRDVLVFLEELLTASPPLRLIVTRPDSPFDPARHEPIHGRPSEGALTVTATLFPGLVRYGPDDRVEEKALVYTDHAAAPA